MQKAENNARLIELTVLTPDSEPLTTRCDSLHLPLRDDLNGRGGGDYNIRRGHAAAILSLGSGTIRAALDGNTVLEKSCSGGFAKVRPDRVTVIAEHIPE